MTRNDVKRLHAGDEVFWNDPEGTESRVYTIGVIEVHGDVVVITEPDGSRLECFAGELS